MIGRIETKPKIRTYRRYEMETMHIFDTQADEEKAFCEVDVPTADLMSVGEYLGRRMDELPVGNVCEPCKIHAIRWAENRVRRLETDARSLLDSADELERMAAGCQAERDAARYRNSAERRRSEAGEFEEEAGELRRFVQRLKRETGLDIHAC